MSLKASTLITLITLITTTLSPPAAGVEVEETPPTSHFNNNNYSYKFPSDKISGRLDHFNSHTLFHTDNFPEMLIMAQGTDA